MSLNWSRISWTVLAVLVGLTVPLIDSFLNVSLSPAFLIALTVSLVFIMIKGQFRKQYYSPNLMVIQTLAIAAIFGWTLCNFVLGFR